MKIKLLLLSLLLSFTFYGQNVNIPDSNFKQALLDFTPTDTNNDGEIQVSEALAVDSLIVGDNWISYDILDLTGIEYFTNLVYLDCHNNQISSLDLSQNTFLEELLCYDNQITTLNITQNTQLNDLYAGGNPITTLDVTNNSWQDGISVTTDDFKSIDYSQLLNARKADGSLPDVTFFNLNAGSDLIDKGIDVGLSFNGSAPDLGAFEF